MITALVWAVAALVAAGVWWKQANAGFRRLIVAISFISLLGTGTTAAYVWKSSAAAASMAAEKADVARRDLAAAEDDTRGARRASELRRSMEELDAAIGAFNRGGAYAPRTRGPDESIIAAEGAVVAAQSELTQAQRIASTRKQGWDAISPVLSWGGFAYLLAILGVGLLIWVTAGFSPRAVRSSEPTAPVAGEDKPVSKSIPYPELPRPVWVGLVVVAVLSLGSFAWLEWAPKNPDASPEIQEARIAQVLADAAVAEANAAAALATAKVEPTAPNPQGTPASTPQPAALTPTRQWLAGWWSKGGFCEGDAGESFIADGRWGEWGVEGRWSLDDNRLTVTKVTRTMDTASGGPEAIDPPERLSGRITNVAEDAFTWRGDRWVRCADD